MIKERDFVYEKSLILSVQKGEHQAFEELYKSYYKKVYFMCYEYFRDSMKAEDVTQEVFICVYKSIAKLSAQEAFNVWLSRVTYNCCHAYYNKMSKDATGNTVNIVIDDNDENTIENLISDEQINDYGTKLEYDRAKKIIMSTLKEMKPKSRLVGFLYFFEQLSYKEIVDITGDSMGTISSRIKRIKEKLKDELEKHHITSTTCMSIMLLPNMSSIYQEYTSEIQVPEPDNGATYAIQGSKHSFMNMKKIPYVISVLLTIAVPTTLVTKQYVSTQMNSHTKASIEKIDFQKELTNKPLAIHVEVSEGVYDKMLLDGDETLHVKENGIHTVELYHKDKMIDRKQFKVHNIDKKAPEVKELDTADSIQLQYHDDNGIAYDDITMYLNGVESKDFILDKKMNTITIKKSIQHKVLVSIADIAGNKIEVDVNFYEVYKKIK